MSPATLGFSTPAPAPRTYWVAPGLLAGCYPGEFVRDLADAGIRHFVNLQPEDELGRGGRPFAPYLDSLAAGSATMARIPFPDMGVPPEAEMIRALDDVDAALDADRPTYVHCWGGQGRTGIVIGCWIRRHGLAGPSEVLRVIEQLRATCADAHKPSPQTPEQCEMVRRWRPGR